MDNLSSHFAGGIHQWHQKRYRIGSKDTKNGNKNDQEYEGVSICGETKQGRTFQLGKEKLDRDLQNIKWYRKTKRQIINPSLS